MSCFFFRLRALYTSFGVPVIVKYLAVRQNGPLNYYPGDRLELVSVGSCYVFPSRRLSFQDVSQQ